MPGSDTRAEHLAWCKQRALQYLDHGGPGALSEVMASLGSDLSKHEGTRGHAGMNLMMGLAMGGHLSTDQEIREFVEGFQ